ncbi:MAG: aminotransferase class V-fold PLP-dependent enzyme [Bacteroidia bacterium]
MVNRRRFIRNSSLAGLGSFLLPAMASAPPVLPPLPAGSLSGEGYWKAIRQQFPLMRERTYFNNGTIGPSPYPVLNAVQKSLWELAEKGDYSGWEEAIPALAKLLGTYKEEIALTHNTTEGINIVAWGLPFKQGDEVIMTTHEHAGNALPWLNRMRMDGIEIKVFEPALTGAGNLERINNLITKKTRCIAVPHITCTTGLVLPVKDIAKLARERGLYVFFDGAHAPGSTVLDLHDMDCDFYAACTHKWLCGPGGTGFLYVKKEMQEVLQPVFTGAEADLGWELNPAGISGFQNNAHRYYYGTQSAALYQGVKAAVAFMMDAGMERVEKRTRELASYLQQQLLEMPERVSLLSATEQASIGPMTTFRLKQLPYKEFGQMASQNHFRIRVVPEGGLDAIRVSTHIYNSYQEIDDFVALLKKTGD